MRRRPIICSSAAAFAVFSLATGAFAQSGEFTEADCIKDLAGKPVTARPATRDIRGTATTLRTIDLDNDGTISREEAQKACSGGATTGEESRRQQQ